MSAGRAPYVRREPEADALWTDEVPARPIPGYYAVRLRRHAVEVGLRIAHEPTPDPETGIALDRSYYWSVWLNSECVWGPDLIEPPLDSLLFRFVRKIDRTEYEFLLADREWARLYAPDSPEANPERGVDLKSMPPVF